MAGRIDGNMEAVRPEDAAEGAVEVHFGVVVVPSVVPAEAVASNFVVV